jgi:two-component system, response regulator PdtaR
MNSNTKILIVEDIIIVATDLKKRLNKLGYNIVGIADNGRATLKIIEETNPDLILMDIILKGDLDGIETVKIINELHDIPHIYLTAHYDDNTLQRASKTQPYGYITKPFDDIGLHTSIQLALYKHHNMQELKAFQKLKNGSKIVRYIKILTEKIIKPKA